MKVFRRLYTLTAILAIVAWANVQVMACCWAFSTPEKTVSSIETASGKHACCQRQSSLPITDGSVAISAPHFAGCGGQNNTPALQSSVPPLNLSLDFDVWLLRFIDLPPVDLICSTPVRNTGPPAFLLFQRLLI